MKYTIEKIENGIKIIGLKNFYLPHIFENGQAFRWEKTEKNSYIIVANSSVAEFMHDKENLIVYNITEKEFRSFWHEYFDLDRDYDEIKQLLSKTLAYEKNDSLKKAIKFGEGLRILNQDEYEIIISFIISANNQIPRIKNSIRLLSETYGEFIEEYKGKKYYSFPKPEILSKANPLEVKEICRVGFRNERIVVASKMFLEQNEKYSDELDDEILGDNLLEIPGVGPKVRDCILLFGYSRDNTFPVDVWVKRLMETLYLEDKISNSKILDQAQILFGNLRGLAQQYLFYYARENKIGK